MTSAAEHNIWRTTTWQLAARFERPAYTFQPGPIAFSLDGRIVALAGRDPSIQLVDLGRMETIAEFETPGIPKVSAVSFSTDGERLLLPLAHIVHVWDLRAVRTELAAIDLDWDLPPYPPRTLAPSMTSLYVEVILGGDLIAPAQDPVNPR
ncbi:MAG: hypothetical protein IH987_03000 [Planctomycetes bacterium]|nr:hypothetical protein [Planctomycetota bacterium]